MLSNVINNPWNSLIGIGNIVYIVYMLQSQSNFYNVHAPHLEHVAR